MNKLLKSKVVTIIALLLIIILLILTFSLRPEWWCFIDIFCAFMMVFTHLLALMLYKMSPLACKKLDVIALIFGICFVISFIVEYLLCQGL